MASASDHRAHAALQPADCLILLPQRLPAAAETSIGPAHYPAECTQSDAFLQPSLRARKGRANSNSFSSRVIRVATCPTANATEIAAAVVMVVQISQKCAASIIRKTLRTSTKKDIAMAVLTTLLEFLTPPNAIFCFVASMATSSVRMDSTRCSGRGSTPGCRSVSVKLPLTCGRPGRPLQQAASLDDSSVAPLGCATRF